MLAPNFTVSVYGSDSFQLYDRLFREYEDQVSVIAVHSHLVTDDVQAYLDQYDYHIPFGLDEAGGVIGAFDGELMLPQTVIIDPQGVIVYNITGQLTYDELFSLLTEAGLPP